MSTTGGSDSQVGRGSDSQVGRGSDSQVGRGSDSQVGRGGPAAARASAPEAAVTAEPNVVSDRTRARQTAPVVAEQPALVPDVAEDGRKPKDRQDQAQEDQAQEDQARKGRGGKVRAFGSGRIVVPALVVLLVACSVAAGCLWWAAGRAAADRSAGPAALAAARAAAPVVLSYDSAHLDADFARAEKLLTGGFAKDYQATTAKVVAPAARQYHAKVTAQVQAAAVVHSARDQVVVLLYVNQTTTSDRLDGPKVDLNRVRMTMVPDGGSWRVAQVDGL